MYDHSGEFFFTMGFPVKSGASGALMIVIPGLMGICTYSPHLDIKGISVRGLAFCEKLSQIYAFHNFESLTKFVFLLKNTRFILPRGINKFIYLYPLYLAKKFLAFKPCIHDNCAFMLHTIDIECTLKFLTHFFEVVQKSIRPNLTKLECNVVS